MGCLRHEYNQLIRIIDPTIPTFLDWTEAFQTIFYLYTGLLPYVKIPYESFSAGYLTRDFLGMVLRDRREKESMFDKGVASIHIFVLFLLKYPASGISTNLNKRGMFTNYWVINEDKDVEFLHRGTNIAGIMTDRPLHVRNLLTSIIAKEDAQAAKVGADSQPVANESLNAA